MLELLIILLAYLRLKIIQLCFKVVYYINPLNAELNLICHLVILLGDLTFMDTCIVSIFQYISNKMQRYTVYLYLETALHISGGISGGTSTHHEERIHLYLQHLVFVTPLLLSAAISWNRFECAVGGVRHPQHTQTSSNSSTIYVEQFPDINKLCNVASCWIYIRILLGAHPILHISRLRVKSRSYN
jgi:hypothetical protein